MDNFIDFFFCKNRYKIGIFNNKNIKSIPFNDTNLNNIYYKCFDSRTSIDNLCKLNHDLAFNIYILDINNNLIFICTIIPNDNTKNLEIYNVCKDLKYRDLSSGIVIRKLIDYLIRPIFYPHYKKIVISIVLHNKYIVPTILCYLNIGFNLLKNKTSMVAVNEAHFQMYLNLRNPAKLNKPQKILIFFYIIYFYFWDIDKLKNVYYKLNRKKITSTNKYKITGKIIDYLNKNLSSDNIFK